MRTLSHISASNTTTESDRRAELGKVESARRVLVIGGTTFIGKLLVEELLRAGHEVSILHRQPKHSFGRAVANLVADRNDASAVQAAVGQARYDAVYDFAYDWERGTTGAQVEQVARLFDGRTSRYIFLSSVAAYGDGLNHHEGDALASDDHPERYARNKAMAERALFRIYQRTGFPIVTLRPPFVYGPGNPYYREAFFWDRFRAHRPIILPSDGHRLMQFIYVNDLVEMAMRVMIPRNFVGHSFNICNARPITQHELVMALARSADNAEYKVVSVARDQIMRGGGQAVGTRLYFGDYFDLPAITMIVTKAQRMLGFKPTDFAAGLRQQFRAYLKKRCYPRPDFAFEDYLINCARNQDAAPRSA